MSELVCSRAFDNKVSVEVSDMIEILSNSREHHVHKLKERDIDTNHDKHKYERTRKRFLYTKICDESSAEPTCQKIGQEDDNTRYLKKPCSSRQCET